MESIHDGPPQLQEDFPFKIEIRSIKATSEDRVTASTPRERKEYFLRSARSGSGGDNDLRTGLMIGATQGELFEIRVWNHSSQRVGMALMIDGLNSVGQQRERLENARLWTLEPTPKDRPYTIEGWYLTTARRDGEEDFERRRFVFTDVNQSVAGRQQFTSSIGLITVGFYKEATGRDIAVGEAQVDPVHLKTKKFKRSRLLGVTQIRYVDARELE